MEGNLARRATEVAEGFAKLLEDYRKGPYNVLVPTTTIQEISPFHKPVLEIVRINSDPDAGEVYEIVKGSKDFALKATALQKVGYAAGLIWNARGCVRTDDGTNQNIVTYKAEAAVRKEDGTYMLLNAEYMVDLAVIEEETRDAYEKKSGFLAKDKKWTEKERQEYVEKNVKRDMLQKRKFRLQLAQTGAMDRVIRKILGLKGTYKKEELDKPFVIPKIAFNPDVSDPKIRDAMLRQGLEATNCLFGPSERNLLEHVTQGQEKGVIDVTSHDEDLPFAETPPNEPAKPPAGHDPLKSIRELMSRKGYAASRLKKPLEQFTVEQMEQLTAFLDKMPDAKTEELPFE